MALVEPVSNRKGVYLVECPGCKTFHYIQSGADKGPNWDFNGDFDKPTFSPSLLVNPNRECPDQHQCHSFIRDGQWQFLNDCTHELAGQTVDMIDVE